jgi:hypothetical protein
MKNKLANLKIGSIQELSATEQKQIKGGGPNSPCCLTSPYYNYNQCLSYQQAGYGRCADPCGREC